MEIDIAVKILKSGGIIIFPTDTAFGIGCRADDKMAIERLFKLRRRPHEKATPVLVSSVEMAKEYVLDIPVDVEEKLIEKYWPGALTIVLEANEEKVPALVRGGGSTVGIRMPNNEIILSIIEKLGVPILGPSANFHGEKTAYDFQDLDTELINLVDLVVEGSTTEKKASTVIDCTRYPWKILREGAVDIKL